MKERYVITLELVGFFVLMAALFYSIGFVASAVIIIGVSIIVVAQTIKQR
jgi:uncharacterized membrane protein